MRFIAHLDERDRPVAGVLSDGHVLTLAALAERAGLPKELARLDVRGLLAADADLAETRAAVARAASATGCGACRWRSFASWRRSCRARSCASASTTASHLNEQDQPIPTRPVLFSKFANTVVGDGEPVIRPATTQALDLEAELGVVIGRRARHVPVETAMDHVAGYVTTNDISARDLQGTKPALPPGGRGDGQWLRAKGSDTFLPLGPCIVTADEVGDPAALRVRGWHHARRRARRRPGAP